VDADDATVNATVSPIFIGVTVNPTDLDYGSLEPGDNMKLPTPDHFTVTNAGTQNVSLSIRGNDTADWTLESAPGVDQYVQHFGTSSGSLPDQILTTDDQDFWASLEASDTNPGAVDVYLMLDMPTSTTSYETQNAAVTIVATAK
jgi:hypothetical protein